MLVRGTRYGAGSAPSEDETAEWYAAACERLEADGVMQYEISNFARARSAPGYGGAGKSSADCDAVDFRSRHNVKYWRREPYVGFGLDAHSMLRSRADGPQAAKSAVRWANPSDLETYLVESRELRTRDRGQIDELRQVASGLGLPGRTAAEPPEVEWVGPERGFEEAVFLGLRMNRGVDLHALRAEFGGPLTQAAVAAFGEVEEAGLACREDNWLRLTARGRMASNEVFSRLLVAH